jgi:hypothetical protein
MHKTRVIVLTAYLTLFADRWNGLAKNLQAHPLATRNNHIWGLLALSDWQPNLEPEHADNRGHLGHREMLIAICYCKRRVIVGTLEQAH